MNITKQELSKIAAFETRGLIPIHEDLIRERMRLDKEMSEFLVANEGPMGYERSKYEHIWEQYHEMGKAYSELIQLLTLTEYYMKRYSLM